MISLPEFTDTRRAVVCESVFKAVKKLSGLMTLKDIAHQLGVPESSLRKYREIFEAFIPSVGSGRARRYREDAIGILQEIRHLREEMHMPWDAITDALAKKYPIDATPASPQTSSQMQMPLQPQQQDSYAMEPPAAQPMAARPAPAQAVAIQQPDNQIFKKMIAVTERQTMLVNALALEMMRSVEKVRADNRSDLARLETKMTGVLNTLYNSIGTYSQHERALLRDVQARLDAVDKSLAAFAAVGDQAAQAIQMKEQLKIISEKLAVRERAIQDYKKNFDVLKKENTDLREFKHRHTENAMEHVREVKGQRAGLKKFFKFKA
ncbi:MAG: MerR family transcriptional regulator [bacterium]